MRTVFLTVGGVIVVGLLTAVSVAYSGSFNVAADWEDPDALRWLLVTTRENSIQSRAADIEVPELTGAKQLKDGFRGYREMCAMCHTPPGAKDSPFTKGMNPTPPDLAKSAKNMTDAELFWATKNGIRMTGMPAWGATHGDKELWDIIAFVKTLTDMDGMKYQMLDKSTAAGHAHGPGSDHGDGGHGDSSHGGIDSGSKSAAGDHDNSDGHHDKKKSDDHDNSDGHHDKKAVKKPAHDNSDGHSH